MSRTDGFQLAGDYIFPFAYNSTSRLQVDNCFVDQPMMRTIASPPAARIVLALEFLAVFAAGVLLLSSGHAMDVRHNHNVLGELELREAIGDGAVSEVQVSATTDPQVTNVVWTVHGTQYRAGVWDPSGQAAFVQSLHAQARSVNHPLGVVVRDSGKHLPAPVELGTPVPALVLDAAGLALTLGLPIGVAALALVSRRPSPRRRVAWAAAQFLVPPPYPSLAYAGLGSPVGASGRRSRLVAAAALGVLAIACGVRLSVAVTVGS